MADLKISQLPEYTGYTTNNFLVVNNSGETTTYKTTKENFFKCETYNAGSFSGTLNVDLSTYQNYIFTLTGNVDVNISNAIEGLPYNFWIYSTGNFQVSTMTIDSGSIYSVGGVLPNPANNAWNLYQGLKINGDFILTEINNFATI